MRSSLDALNKSGQILRFSMLMADSELNSHLRAVAGSSILHFCKMQALGNDFVVVSEDELDHAIDSFKLNISGPSADRFLARLSVKVCSRRFGVGADGFIVVRRGLTAGNLSWTYLNNDGSSSLMCGNGLRCLALWSMMHKWTASKHFYVETGKFPVEIVYDSPDFITSDLGEPILKPSGIPVNVPGDTPIVARDFQIGADSFKISCVSIGNPHCVIFENEFDDLFLDKLASSLQANSFFPEGVNVEFVQVISNNHVRVIVYERGCARTLACASGAGAVVVAAALQGLTGRDVCVQLEGGSLHVSWSEIDNHLRISGPASMVYDGEIDLSLLIPEASAC